jgi:hypothetical protein
MNDDQGLTVELLHVEPVARMFMGFVAEGDSDAAAPAVLAPA